MTRLKVAIAGASGFVGRALIEKILAEEPEIEIIGLSRQAPSTFNQTARLSWRHCDLFSLAQCEKALEGAQVAVYLVHSMMPSARLTQAHFEDLDLIIADNFARAAAQAGIKHILFLGGLLPNRREQFELSSHLRSRLEVEKTLASRKVPVTALRAGIVIGPEGSSFNILTRLIERMPVILCPPWTESLTQPIDLRDVIRLFIYHIKQPAPDESRSIDIGCPEILSYRELLQTTARLMNKKRYFLRLPFNGSLWWKYNLGWFVGAPNELVVPLLESMKHSLVAQDRSIQLHTGIPGISLENAISNTLSQRKQESASHRISALLKNPFQRYWQGRGNTHNDVRSVQRLSLPKGKGAIWAALEYTVWLPLFLKTFIRAGLDEERNLVIQNRWPRITLLQLTFSPERSLSPDRQLFLITGGALARIDSHQLDGEAAPRLELREALDKTVLLAAIHDFKPKLPWFIYSCTQAIIHLWVMKQFGKHLIDITRRRR